MKFITAIVMTLGLSAVAQASDLNQNALETLLNTPDLSVNGDVHSYETVESIYNSAVESNARIDNQCEVIRSSKIAKCTLWLTFKPMGETAIEYTVNLPGTSMNSNFVNVARGD